MNTILQETEEALGGSDLPRLQSRSLRLTRYADPTLEKDRRKLYLQAVTRAENQRSDGALDSWSRWFQANAPAEGVVYARLEARLLVNTAGTVLENAGLQLDRFGTAYVPGSAVKGCARRAALAALRDWIDEGEALPSDHPLAPIAAPFAEPEELLLAIVRVFGCSDAEWEAYDHETNRGSDFAWACGERWPQLRDAVLESLGARAARRSESAKPSIRGSVAFLPAYPRSRPSADLELDVLTPHHKDYYAGKREVALDDEDPVPVYFPAVAAGAIYAFGILPLSRADTSPVSRARAWLLAGLQAYGLGAKTNAGYGWFSDATDSARAEIDAEAERLRKARAEADRRARLDAERDARKRIEEARAAMTPEDRADADLSEIASDWGKLKPHLEKFKDLDDAAKAALIRWFTNAPEGRKLWLEQVRPMQGKAKDRALWKRIQPQIFTARRELKLPNLP